jgi:hypothetical protein
MPLFKINKYLLEETAQLNTPKDTLKFIVSILIVLIPVLYHL